MRKYLCDVTTIREWPRADNSVFLWILVVSLDFLLYNTVRLWLPYFLILIPAVLNSFETGNGIVVEERGIPKSGPDGSLITAVQGSNAYRSADGSIIQTQYTADEHGYQAYGDHLPTPPPPNPIILRALEWLASLPSTPAPSSQAPYKNY